jgi:pimeloyl-ACP methyl ester carboxylesterase
MRAGALRVLATRLRTAGYAVGSFEYRSVRASFDENVAALEHFVAGLRCDALHLVGHSLGGVLIRALLDRDSAAPIRRVVCLGSPLRGSRTARRVARLPGGRFLIGKTLLEHDARGGFGAWAGAAEAGCIAGDLALGAGLLTGPFGEPNDGTVAVAETKVAGLRDHIVLPVSHMALMWSHAVGDQVEHFLAQGRFQHARPG